MLLIGSGPESVHQCLGQIHRLILCQRNAAAHTVMRTVPVSNIDLRFAAIPCDYVDLLTLLLSAFQAVL